MKAKPFLYSLLLRLSLKRHLKFLILSFKFSILNEFFNFEIIKFEFDLVFSLWSLVFSMVSAFKALIRRLCSLCSVNLYWRWRRYILSLRVLIFGNTKSPSRILEVFLFFLILLFVGFVIFTKKYTP